MLIGFVGVLYTMYAWWSDVIHEAESGDHTPVVRIPHRYGMMLFIASEVMFFVAWFWAYFEGFFAPRRSGPVCAPRRQRRDLAADQGVELFNPFHLPLFNTLLLLTSGTTVTWAHHALLHGDREGPKMGPGADHRAGHQLHLRPGARIFAAPASPMPATSTARPSSWRPASTAST